MKKIIPIILILMLFVAGSAQAGNQPVGSQTVKIPGGPNFWVHDVDRDTSVTIKGDNYPDGGEVYDVYLGRPGNLFGYGIWVGRVSSTSKTFSETYKIPAQLRGQANLGLQLKNKADGSYGYLIFANTDGWGSGDLLSLDAQVHSSAQTGGNSVLIFNGPRYWVHDVDRGNSFTLRFVDHFDNDTYAVYVGKNNSNYRNTLVGRIIGNDPYRFYREFGIPNELKGESELKVVVENIFNGHSGATAFTNIVDWKIIAPYGSYTKYYSIGSSSTSYGSTPFTSILNVVKDGEVTLQTFNFPANKDFVVTMGPAGTQGIGGIVIGTQSSGAGGSFIATYTIPPQLRGADMISIRLQSTSSKHFAYDYFKNEDGYDATSSGVIFNGDWTLNPGSYPSTTVVGVVADSTVTVTGINFTQNDVYTVRMGPFGTMGVNGVIVGTKATDASRSFTASFAIPDSLKGLPQIAIRFESNNTSYYAYDWFNNVSTSP